MNEAIRESVLSAARQIQGVANDLFTMAEHHKPAEKPKFTIVEMAKACQMAASACGDDRYVHAYLNFSQAQLLAAADLLKRAEEFRKRWISPGLATLDRPNPNPMFIDEAWAFFRDAQ